jgi:hypothetical protein
MQRAQRSSGVIAAAIVVFLGSAFTVLMALSMVLVFFVFGPIPTGASAPTPPMDVRPFMLVSVVFYLGLAGWGIATGVGLLKLKAWARVSILVFSGFMIATFGMGAVSLLFVSRLMPAMPGGPPPSTIFGVAAAAMAIPILIAVWWLMYFNRKSVRAQFEEYRTTGEYSREDGSAKTLFRGPQRPVSITLIALLFLFAVLFFVLAPFRNYPALLFGAVITGNAARAIHLVYLLLYLYMGIGLLKLKPGARVVAIYVSVFNLANGLCFLLLPRLEERFNKLFSYTPTLAPLPPHLTVANLMPLLIIGHAFSLALTVLIIWLLVTRRNAFSREADRPAG